MLLLPLAKLLLGKLLGSDVLKKAVFDELRAAAASSENKIDDEAVEAASVIWDVVAGNVR